LVFQRYPSLDGRWTQGFARSQYLEVFAGIFEVNQSKMVTMRSVRICLPILILITLTATFAFAGDEENSIVNFTVIRDYNGKPVRNASVILHSVNKDGKQIKGGAQLKTDGEGKTSYPGLPYGRVRVQVIAPGLQTFGDDYEVKDKTTDIQIKMKRPTDQYTIYK
jgi:hypothetical protein